MLLSLVVGKALDVLEEKEEQEDTLEGVMFTESVMALMEDLIGLLDV